MDRQSIYVSVLSVAVACAAWSVDVRAEGPTTDKAGAIGKVQDEIKRLGGEAAKRAKQAEEAAQKAEAFANKLSGQDRADAEQAARAARQDATDAKATSERLQQKSAAGSEARVEEAQQAMREASSKSGGAERHADKALRSGQSDRASQFTSDNSP